MRDSTDDRLLDECIRRLSPSDAAMLMPRFRSALERYALAPPLLYSIATLCLQYGYTELWEYYDRLAFTLPHVAHEDFYFRAQAKIRRGDWSGWADREARLISPHEATIWQPHFREMQWTTRAWDGKESIQGKVLLVVADGGFGDCLQMLRYVPHLAALAGSLLIAVRPEMRSLVQSNFGHLVTVTSIDEPPSIPFQRYVWLMSLPALIGFIPRFKPLCPPSPLCLDGLPADGLRVGLCWAGTSHHPNDRDDNLRSLTLDDLTPFFGLEYVRWYSLQVGRWASNAADHPNIVQPPMPISTFAESANLVAALDCVVTIDTSVAHLAGSLGVPTLVLLTWLPEFRWGLASETTAWYPSLRLLRQSSPGDWPGVVSRVLARLSAHRTTGYTGVAASA
jgi:hypothetical protein